MTDPTALINTVMHARGAVTPLASYYPLSLADVLAVLAARDTEHEQAKSTSGGRICDNSTTP